MPRMVALVLTAVLLAAALLAAAAGRHLLPLAIPVAILLPGLLFERYIYKPIRPEPPGPGWDRTQERFADPRSGQTVVVYYNARTGERRYIAEPRLGGAT
jgi:hypothetical protein